MSDIIPTGWSIAGIGDFNGDGISDILLRCDATGETTDWLGQTGGSFTDNLANADLIPDPSWHVVGTGDFNGGGRADVVWQNNDGRVTDWLGQLNGSFVGNNLSINPGTSWHVVGTGDFNGDGRSDVLWQNDDGRLTDWLAQPDGSFVGNQLSLNPGNNWHVIGTGDFNGDGRADILWQYDSGQLNDWLGQPDGSFVNNGANMGQVLDLSWHAAGVGDFNGDHRADILWRCTDGTITDWLGTSSGSFVDNSAIGLQSLSNDLQVSGVGDFNGDGKSDVLWRNPDGTLETWVGSANGGILSPMEKLWQDAVTGAGQLVNTVVNSLPPPTPTDSGGDGRGISLTGFAAIFGPSFPTNYVEGLYDEVHAFTLNTFDPSEGSGFDFTWSASSNVGGGAQQFGSITQFDSGNAYLFDVNGADLIGNWFAGAPPVSEPIPPDAIVITASSAIVITASHETTTGFFLFDPNANGFNFNDGYGGRSGGGGRNIVPYTAAGNAWANAHIHLIGTTQADVHASNVMHDALAKFYDWASANPNALIQIGNGTTVFASTALADFNQVTINVQSTGGGPNGGITTPDGFGGAGITINPENSNLSSEHSQYGDAIYNYAIFHELGHALDNANAQSLYNSPDTEAYANTAARSMENYLHIPLPNFPNATPPGGYK